MRGASERGVGNNALSSNAAKDASTTTVRARWRDRLRASAGRALARRRGYAREVSPRGGWPLRARYTETVYSLLLEELSGVLLTQTKTDYLRARLNDGDDVIAPTGVLQVSVYKQGIDLAASNPKDKEAQMDALFNAWSSEWQLEALIRNLDEDEAKAVLG